MLVRLRYLLLILPAVGTAWFVPLSEMGQLTCLLLLLFAWDRLRQSRLPDRLQPMAAAIETLALIGLSHLYGGLLFLCHFSTLISAALHSKGRLHPVQLAVHLIGLNASLHGTDDWRLLAAANLCALTTGGLLLRLTDTGEQKKQLERVYDELRSKAYELDAARSRLVEYAGKVEQLAQAEERTRIARDIHDELGHKLIRSKMMLEAAVRLMPEQPERAHELTVQVRDHLTDSMESLRHTVRKLKPADAELQSYSLHRLIDNLAADHGLEVRHHISGLPRPIYPSLEIILYRNAQEAVTNAIRHGGASEIGIHLHYAPAQVVMTVSNNGRRPDLASLRKGLGLSGMEERVRLVGGDLQLRGDDSFAVVTSLPLHAGG
ncbi:Signal transduction histidine kinase [Paenibacillus sp. UNCCL117]|uniref:sensor histidine kinase n=1 Tax=unclassified Paenibacillus TaxID=185978 RepID=UPI00088A835E|nr:MULTISPECIES: sensor histidine kinase [unclassified Paenibacillus]SDC78782.1 Signal transduction histidine kinase [Paenibacillus sp. cl123]SFW26144.1 Signal transduction histidine kinase [Paenibacillus sp. UNCCL117]